MTRYEGLEPRRLEARTSGTGIVRFRYYYELQGQGWEAYAVDPGETLVFPRVGRLTVMAAIAQSPVWRWRVVVRGA